MAMTHEEVQLVLLAKNQFGHLVRDKRYTASQLARGIRAEFSNRPPRMVKILELLDENPALVLTG